MNDTVRTRLGAPAGALKVIKLGCGGKANAICKAVVNEHARAFNTLHCPTCNRILDMTGG